MQAETRRSSHWIRGFALMGISVLGLVAIVGSGGGFVGSICDTYPESCIPPPPTPSVSVEPPSVTALVGTSVTFVAQTVNTSGSLAYQWRRSSDSGTTYLDIAGATERTYGLASVNLADDGDLFRAVVRQADGVVLEATARLAVSVTPGILFEDGDFQLAHWQASPALLGGSPAFNHVEEHVDAGGNPGALRKMSDQVAPGSSLSYLTHLSLVSAYDPRVQGAIRVIDYAEDCVVFSASDINYVETGLLLEQSGRRYVTDRMQSLCTTRSWTSTTRPSLRQEDFRQLDGPACEAGEACPDFSASASTLRFGYERIAQTTPGGSVMHGIDNWRVTVWRR
jgi:hypothetical protein